MVIDQACRLHEGVADCRADELEAALLEGFAHRVRFRRCRGDVLDILPLIVDRGAVDELPDIAIERAALGLDIEKYLRIGHGGSNFEAVADDARVVE